MSKDYSKCTDLEIIGECLNDLNRRIELYENNIGISKKNFDAIDQHILSINKDIYIIINQLITVEKTVSLLSQAFNSHVISKDQKE